MGIPKFVTYRTDGVSVMSLVTYVGTSRQTDSVVAD